MNSWDDMRKNMKVSIVMGVPPEMDGWLISWKYHLEIDYWGLAFLSGNLQLLNDNGISWDMNGILSD